MYRNVYFHKVVRSAEGMVKLALQRAKRLAVQERLEWPARETPVFKALLGQRFTIDEFRDLDDVSVWHCFKVWTNSADGTLSGPVPGAAVPRAVQDGRHDRTGPTPPLARHGPPSAAADRRRRRPAGTRPTTCSTTSRPTPPTPRPGPPRGTPCWSSAPTGRPSRSPPPRRWSGRWTGRSASAACTSPPSGGPGRRRGRRCPAGVTTASPLTAPLPSGTPRPAPPPRAPAGGSSASRCTPS